MIARFLLACLALAVPIAPASAVYQNGIDISVHQGTITWSSVKSAGIKFAFTKATEGVDFIDTTFVQNMSNAKTAGVLIGPYHFARPDSYSSDPNDAANEANDFVDAIQSYYVGTNLTLRPVLDIERKPVVADVPTFMANWIINFATVVHNRLGFYPIIYANTDYATNYIGPGASQYDLWLANWTNNVNNPPGASADGIWNGWKFWQWTSTGSVSGISGNVDRDVYNGTMSQLAQYIPDFHAGDFDNNGIVDGRDYVRWRNTMGQTVVTPGSGADGDLSGVIDQADITIWRTNFNKTYASGAGSLSVGTIPEPSGLFMLLIGVLVAAAGRLRKRRL